MFNCAFDGHTTKPKEPMHKVVVQTRKRVYTSTNLDGLEVQRIGWEIVRELSLCERHAGLYRLPRAGEGAHHEQEQ